MKMTFVIVQIVIGMTAFLHSNRLDAQVVRGLRSNSYYRSFAEKISAAAEQQQQRQQGFVTIAGVRKADFSSLSDYNLYPVRRLQLIESKDSVHEMPRLEVGEAALLIVQPIPYKGSLFVFDVKRNSINVLANLTGYEEAFQYGSSASLSFGYFLESEKYLATIPI
jgi:hypothetical protein